MANTSKLLVALAAGAAVGIAAGILLAPDKGSETRKKIAGQGRKLTGQLNDTIREGKDHFNKLKSELEAELEVQKEKLQEFA